MLAIISIRKKMYVLMAIICWILKAHELFTISAPSNSHVFGNDLENLIQLGWKKDAAALKWSSEMLMFVVHRCHLLTQIVLSSNALGLLLCLPSWTLNPEFWHARPVFYFGATPVLTITVYLTLSVFVLNTVYVNFTGYFDSITIKYIAYAF